MSVLALQKFRRSRSLPPSSTVVVVYRPGSCNATQSCFDDYCDLLKLLSTFSAPLMIAGDFNIHVDDVTDTHIRKLSDILSCQSTSASLLTDPPILLIPRNDRNVAVLPIDPPLLRPVVRRCLLQLSDAIDINRVSSST